MITFSLVPQILSITQNILEIDVADIDSVERQCTLHYRIMASIDGKVLKRGQKTVSLAVLTLLTASPLNITAINTAIASLGISLIDPQP